MLNMQLNVQVTYERRGIRDRLGPIANNEETRWNRRDRHGRDHNRRYRDRNNDRDWDDENDEQEEELDEDQELAERYVNYIWPSE